MIIFLKKQLYKMSFFNSLFQNQEEKRQKTEVTKNNTEMPLMFPSIVNNISDDYAMWKPHL